MSGYRSSPDGRLIRIPEDRYEPCSRCGRDSARFSQYAFYIAERRSDPIEFGARAEPNDADATHDGASKDSPISPRSRRKCLSGPACAAQDPRTNDEKIAQRADQTRPNIDLLREKAFGNKVCDECVAQYSASRRFCDVTVQLRDSPKSSARSQ